jgi:RHS repeat-associated protein
LYNNLYSAGSPLNGFLSGQPAVPNTTPRAYLNYIFFDEQFNYIGASSGADPVGGLVSPATTKEGMVSLPFNTLAPKNGYVYIYLSNESKNIPVFFDDFNVVHQRGVITEDNVYYPLGLRISGISAKAALLPKAKYGYQGNYSLEDAETGYNEFALRSYDPQIGRWIQADPYDVEPGMYNGMGNDWVNMVDEDGGAPFDWFRGLKSNAVIWLEGNTDAYTNIGGEEFQNIGSGEYMDPTPITIGGPNSMLGGYVREAYQVWKPGGKESYLADITGNPLDRAVVNQAIVRQGVEKEPTFWQKWNYLNGSGLMRQFGGLERTISSNLLYNTANDVYITATNPGVGYYQEDLSGDLVGSKQRTMAGINTLMLASGPALKPIGTFAPATDAVMGSRGVIVADGGQFVSEMSIVREIQKGEKISDLITLAQNRTYVYNVEHAIVRLGPNSVAPGARVLVSGGRNGISFGDQISFIWGHTHPYPTGVSHWDRLSLNFLGQTKQYIYEGFNSLPIIAKPY